MQADKLRALVDGAAKVAVHGRANAAQELFDMGTVGVSVTIGHSGKLGGRGVLVCAVGPNGKAADAVGYAAMPSNNEVRRRIGALVRTLVATVEGMQGAESEVIQ